LSRDHLMDRNHAFPSTDGLVLGVVVTYNPGPDLRENLTSVRAQVNELLIVDNGSADAHAVEVIGRECGCLVVRNGENLGLATALNQAVAHAKAAGFAWLLTLDQDSRPNPGVVSGLLSLSSRLADNCKVGVVGAGHRDRATGEDYRQLGEVLSQTTDWLEVRTTITSGSLFRVRLFDRTGPFDDRLFIDAVDHDFCLRCRRMGYSIFESRYHHIDHALGEISAVRIGPLTVRTTNHNAVRRYYITRNTLEVCRRYALIDPIWTVRSLAHLLYINLLSIVLERDRLEKMKAEIAGLADFAFGRFGRRDFHR